MAETATIEMQDRELFAAMAMQALITRGERWAADLIAKQAVAYADALIVALAAVAPKPPAESPSSISKKNSEVEFSPVIPKGFFADISENRPGGYCSKGQYPWSKEVE